MNLEIKEQRGKKYEVFVDGKFYCRCYLKDLLSIGVSEDTELNEEVLYSLNQRIFLPRAKKRALNLLDQKYYTAQAMRTKLSLDGYPQDVTDATVEYLEDLHFIADERYAEDLAASLLKKYSERETIRKMQVRGLSREMIAKSITSAKMHYLSENEGSDFESQECIAIRSIVRKKSPEVLADPDKRKKFMMLLYRKGFGLSSIKQVLGEAEGQEGEEFYT